MTLLAPISDGPALLYLFGLAGAFESLQMVPADINLLPQYPVSALVALKIFMRPGNLTRAGCAALDMNQLATATAYYVYALMMTILLPRMFAGMVHLVPLNGELNGTTILHPMGGNITQAGYALESYFLILAFYVVGNNGAFQRQYRNCALVFGAALVITGAADLFTYKAGLSSLLEPFRTANYALLADNEVLGAKRVVGVMPEASVFGSSCLTDLTFLFFVRQLFEPRLRIYFVYPLIAALLLFVLLSTSTGAYVGLAFVATLAAISAAINVGPSSIYKSSALLWLFLTMLGAALAIVFILLAFPSVGRAAYEYVQRIVFDKGATQSYYERSRWTFVAMRAFFDTGGLGVGLGSVRASNWFVSILASTGVVGFGLFVLLVYKLLLSRTHSADRAHTTSVTALRFTLMQFMFVAFFSGTIPDVGPWLASIIGMLAAASSPFSISRAKGAKVETPSEFASPLANQPRAAPST
jgi:hypothetical protein